jgi:hypothetical protein
MKAGHWLSSGINVKITWNGDAAVEFITVYIGNILLWFRKCLLPPKRQQQCPHQLSASE